MVPVLNGSCGRENPVELKNELKRKLSLERSRHLVSTWTIEKLKLWLLKMDDLWDTRGLIPGLGTWRRQWRFMLKHKYILDLQREAGDLIPLGSLAFLHLPGVLQVPH